MSDQEEIRDISEESESQEHSASGEADQPRNPEESHPKAELSEEQFLQARERERKAAERLEVIESAPDPSTLGGRLRRRRLELGIPLEEVCAATHIPREHVEAIEQNRIDAIPGQVYAWGFIRSLADHLGLELDEEAGVLSVQESPWVVKRGIRGVVPAFEYDITTWLVLMLICALGLVAYYRFNPSTDAGVQAEIKATTDTQVKVLADDGRLKIHYLRSGESLEVKGHKSLMIYPDSPQSVEVSPGKPSEEDPSPLPQS